MVGTLSSKAVKIWW